MTVVWARLHAVDTYPFFMTCLSLEFVKLWGLNQLKTILMDSVSPADNFLIVFSFFTLLYGQIICLAELMGEFSFIWCCIHHWRLMPTAFSWRQVCGWRNEHLLQCCGPSRGRRPWTANSHHPRQSGHQHHSQNHLHGTPATGMNQSVSSSLRSYPSDYFCAVALMKQLPASGMICVFPSSDLCCLPVTGSLTKWPRKPAEVFSWVLFFSSASIFLLCFLLPSSLVEGHPFFEFNVLWWWNPPVVDSLSSLHLTL